jgi:hypothetical protein
MSGYKSGMKGADVLALLKNGLPIVDDVSKLDPNAELGSMASVVTAGSIQETSLSDLPQPDASIIDQTTMVLNASNCPLVSGLSVIVPTSTIPATATISESEMIYFVSESIDLYEMTFGTMFSIMPLIQNGELMALMAMYMDVATKAQQNFTLFSITNGVVTADQDAINQVNTLINGLHYVGAVMYVVQGQTLPAEVLAVYDMVVKAVADVPSITDIYVKGDEWGQLYKKDLDKLVSALDKTKTTAESKADKIAIATYTSYKGLQPNVYTTYSISSTGSVTIKLAAISDTTIYNEYILELKCTRTPSIVAFNNADGTAATIVWANGDVPTFEAGVTYLISIANGLAVYSMFTNS